MLPDATPPAKTSAQRRKERSLAEQLLKLEADWPLLYDCIDPERVSEESNLLISRLADRAFDFDSIARGGRGELYRRAQQNPLIRSVGIRQLFEFVATDCDLRNITSAHRILDVLGGDGVLARATRDLFPPDSMPNVLTSDLSEGMVLAAQEYGLFAMQQAAQKLLLKDAAVDGVIIAYGTHHIPLDQRLEACKEAFRVLRTGGRIVFHDFDQDSPMSSWFSEVVDKYSLTGHRFPHFTQQEISGLLTDAAFININVRYMYDPFNVTAESEQEAKDEMCKYLIDMYGLSKLVDRYGHEGALKAAYSLACRHFRYDYQRFGLSSSFGTSEVQTFEKDGQWHVEVPRLALVGYAEKPSLH